MVTKKQLTMISIGIALAGLLWGINTTEASIDYWLDKNIYFYKGVNFIFVNCKNGGNADGDFSLIITFTNVTFSNETEYPYNKINENEFSFRFILHKDETASKKVYFIVDENVTSFSISVEAKKTKVWYPEKFNAYYPTLVNYNWSEVEDRYILLED